MGKLMDINSRLIYKRAVELLEENKIEYDKIKLISDPEFCLDIVNLLEHFKEKAKS